MWSHTLPQIDLITKLECVKEDKIPIYAVSLKLPNSQDRPVAHMYSGQPKKNKNRHTHTSLLAQGASCICFAGAFRAWLQEPSQIATRKSWLIGIRTLSSRKPRKLKLLRGYGLNSRCNLSYGALLDKI